MDGEVRVEFGEVGADGGEEGAGSWALGFDGDGVVFFVGSDEGTAAVELEDDSAAPTHGFVDEGVVADDEAGDDAAGENVVMVLEMKRGGFVGVYVGFVDRE